MPALSSNKATHSGFETQRRHHLKSKIGVSVAQNLKKKRFSWYDGEAKGIDSSFSR